jgi:hypothetical protein
MKKFLCLVTAAIVLLAFCPAAFSSVNDFAGKWTNTNRNTRGVTTLDITVKGRTVTIHAWGKCHPKDCDWGTISARYLKNGTLQAAYKTKIAIRTLLFTMTGKNMMKAQVLTHFIDKSGRKDYRSVESFKRAAGGAGKATTATRPAAVAPAGGSRTIKKPKGNIKIIYPNGGEVWAQGNRYSIKYETKMHVGYVSISLMNTKTSREYTVLKRWNAVKVPVPSKQGILPGTGAKGVYDPPVPCNVSRNIPPGKYKVRMATLDGSDWDESNRTFTIRGPVDVDLVCDIRNSKGKSKNESYSIKARHIDLFKPHVWAKNNGTKRLKHVLIDYRVLKLPQKLVIVQESEGVGFGDVYPGTWYNAPLTLDLKKQFKRRGIRNKKGRYVLEVVVDPRNRHHERKEYRSDNTDEVIFEIK